MLQNTTRKTLLAFLLYLSIPLAVQSQAMRYFEFKTGCGHGRWQDTSFIAATNDTRILDTVLHYLAKPVGERNRIIVGKIDYGNGGFNHNAGHWFQWHFIPNEWQLQEVAMEVCDGCPYSDIDADTAYWIGNLTEFCPWTATLMREVAAPLLLHNQEASSGFTIFPNPAKKRLYINHAPATAYTASIYNALGQCITTIHATGSSHAVDIEGWPAGNYLLKIRTDNEVATIPLVITD